jgi:TonB family protein
VIAHSFYHSSDLSWTILEEDRRRFRKILQRVFLVCLLFALLIPFLPIPQIEREKAEALPPRLAKLVLERKQAKPPTPAKTPELKSAKKAPKLKKAKQKAKPKLKKAKQKAKPKKIEAKKIETARQKAQRAGLLAFADELAELRDHDVLKEIQRNSSLIKSTERKAAPVERSLITANASSGSGGINTSKLSRGTGGTALAGRATTQVSSPVDEVGTEQGDVPGSGGSRKASRSIEEIQLVFDRNKAAIYSIYNRALRKDPTLEGKVVLKLTISPDGRVVACELVSSELSEPALARKIVARVRLFDFGAREVETMVVTYPIDFLPS